MVNIKVIHHSLLSILKTFNIYQMIALYFLKLSRTTIRQNVLALNWLNCNHSPTACNNKPADVIFMVDKSSSLGSVANFDKELSFIARFVDGFNIGQGPRDVRVGVISFSTDAQLEFGLSSYDDKSSLLNALLNIDFSLGNTYTHKAFEVLLNQGFSTSTRPSTVPSVGKVRIINWKFWDLMSMSV